MMFMMIVGRADPAPLYGGGVFGAGAAGGWAPFLGAPPPGNFLAATGGPPSTPLLAHPPERNSPPSINPLDIAHARRRAGEKYSLLIALMTSTSI